MQKIPSVLSTGANNRDLVELSAHGNRRTVTLSAKYRTEAYSLEMNLAVLNSFIDVLSDPRDDAERLTQARLGENLREIRKHTGFSLVECEDGYVGWIRRKGIVRRKSRSYAQEGDVVAFDDPFTPISSGLIRFRPFLVAPMGSRLSLSREEKGKKVLVLPDGRIGYATFGDIRQAANPFPRKGCGDVVNTALDLQGVPYLWGGTTPWGLDCSGFSQLVFRMNGYRLKRDAHMQYETAGSAVKLARILPGDLLFFKQPSETKVSHVAVYIGSREIVHASGTEGRVVVQSLDLLQPLLVGARRICAEIK